MPLVNYREIFLFYLVYIGGMDELTLEQLKTKSELEEDIDFENGEFTFYYGVEMVEGQWSSIQKAACAQGGGLV